MVGCSSPILHQPKLRGDIHVIPLSNWQANGIRKPSQSSWDFSLFFPQEYLFWGNQEKEGEERKLKSPPRKILNSEVTPEGIQVIKEKLQQVESRESDESSSDTDTASQTVSSQHETEENQNSRDSGSSSEDGGKKDGS